MAKGDIGIVDIGIVAHLLFEGRRRGTRRKPREVVALGRAIRKKLRQMRALSHKLRPAKRGRLQLKIRRLEVIHTLIQLPFCEKTCPY